jgi:hypothetical protein
MAWGAIQAWNYRFELFFGDSQAYFDMATYYSQGKFAEAVSLYWSPLYPMIAGAMFKVIPQDPYWQFFQFKFVNLFFLPIVFLSYDFFFGQFYRYYTDIVANADPGREIADKNILRFCGYALLIQFSLAFGGVHQDTPDMINACTFFLSGGLLLRLLVAPTKLHACLFGLSLGFGYLCKAIMFCMSLIYEALLVLKYAPLKLNIKNNLMYVVLSLATMAILATPWICTLSGRVGKLTFGESAKFVYINLVENKDPLKVEGLEHPPRVIFEKPLIREYATPVPGTVPFLYDLGYWSYGAKVNIRVLDLVMVILCDLLYYLETFLYIPILVIGFVAFKSRSWPLSWKSIIASAPIWIPPVALCAQYALVNNLYMIPYIDRYFIAAYPLLMLAILISFRLPKIQSGNLINKACLFTSILCLLIALPRLTFDVTGLFKERQNAWYQIAQALSEAGVKPGDQVAQLGGRLHRNTQYTEPHKIKLIASVYDEDYFWTLDETKRAEVYDCLRKAGARALVYVRIPDMEDPIITRDLKIISSVTGVKLKSPFKEFPVPTNTVGWKDVPGVEACYYILDR